MKIGFVGNTNNYPFMFASYLRTMGHSLVFVVTEKALLHRPESRHPEFRQGYPDWIVDFSHLDEWDFIAADPKLAPMLDRLLACDALVLNSVGPSLLPFLNRPAVTLLTGSDLSHYASPEIVETRTATWGTEHRESPEGRAILASLSEFVERQRIGIRDSAAVCYFPRGVLPDDDRLLDSIGVPDSRRQFIQSADTDTVKLSPPPGNDPLRVFCGARLTWKLPMEAGRSPLDYKGVDKALDGIALFYQQTGIRLDVRLVRKGLHIRETEELIARNGIADQVTWLEEMPLIDFWREIAEADIVFDQLGDGAIGMVGMDAMATGRPLIANARDEMFDGRFEEPSPICQAKSAAEVCAQLCRLATDRREREELGRRGRRYVEQYFSPQSGARRIEEILMGAVQCAGDPSSRKQGGLEYILPKLQELRRLLLEADLKLSEERETIDRYLRFVSQFQWLIRIASKLPYVRRCLNFLPADSPVKKVGGR